MIRMHPGTDPRSRPRPRPVPVGPRTGPLPVAGPVRPRLPALGLALARRRLSGERGGGRGRGPGGARGRPRPRGCARRRPGGPAAAGAHRPGQHPRGPAGTAPAAPGRAYPGPRPARRGSPRPRVRGPWLVTRLREQATWRELGHALLFALLLWPLDALVLALALAAPLHLAATPLLDGHVRRRRESQGPRQRWTVTTWPAASRVAVLGLLLLALGGYALGLAAGARAELARVLVAAPREGDPEPGSSNSPAPGCGWWTPSRPSGAGSNATCTTAPSSAWSPDDGPRPGRLDAPPGPAGRPARQGARRGGPRPGGTARTHRRHPPRSSPTPTACAACTSAYTARPLRRSPIDVALELPGRLPGGQARRLLRDPRGPCQHVGQAQRLPPARR